MKTLFGFLFSDKNKDKKLEEIQKNVIGDAMTVAEFLEDVDCGGISDYDGIGYWLDKDGNEIDSINFDTIPEDIPENAVYVEWCNK